MQEKQVVVFGAAGHTGRFVVAELARRGRKAIVAGRNEAALRAAHPDAEVRVATVDDAASLGRMAAGAAAVINAAGPFSDTAAPVLDAALRAGAHYLDVTAEQQVALATLAHPVPPGLVAVPAVAFYGGLSDLLATAALGDWPDADAVEIGMALDSWHPTLGTRITGEKNTARRLVVMDHELVPVEEPRPERSWDFPEPFGRQEVVAVALSDIVTIAAHIDAREIRQYMNRAPLADLADEATPPPRPADEQGRSDQVFLMEAVVRRGGEVRRASATGRDIYAVTAPLVVEATERILDGRARTLGAVRPIGALFDPREVLEACDGWLIARFS